MTALSGGARDRLAAALSDGHAAYYADPRMVDLKACQLDALLPVVAKLADLRAAEALESAARGVMAGATEVRGLPGAVRQALTVAASVISARAAALTPTAEGATP